MAQTRSLKALVTAAYIAGVLSSNLPRNGAHGKPLLNLPVVRHPTSSHQRRDATGFLATIINEQWIYGIEIEIGTPPQKTYVEVDTGSDQLWVNADCSTVPQELGQNEICEMIPDFDLSQSSTIQNLSSSWTLYYGNSTTKADVDYYSDVVAINGINITSQQFGVATESQGLISGILGLGPYLTGFAINQTYPRVLDNMFKQGLVNSRAYGLHLGDSDDATGSLTFGGLDRGKFIGALQGVPIVRSRDNRARLTVDYDSLSLSLPSNGTKQYTINDTNVLLDSGTTLLNLEASLAEQIYEELGATVDNSTGYPIVDCSVRNWTGGLTVIFGSKPITISYHNLIFAAEGLCAVGIQALPSGEQQILGVPFLRAAYAIFDFDNLNIHLAQAGNCTSELMTIEPGNGYFNTTGSCSGDTTPTSSTPAGSTPTASLGTKPVESYRGLTACLLFISAVLLGAI